MLIIFSMLEGSFLGKKIDKSFLGKCSNKTDLNQIKTAIKSKWKLVNLNQTEIQEVCINTFMHLTDAFIQSDLQCI